MHKSLGVIPLSAPKNALKSIALGDKFTNACKICFYCR
ncbi:hypothetical protein GCHA_2186 [Paraglaciecola chathamensis S18K6]|uniref:Uncharacterized protein n=1 Tax=Paraglaciecola chathamensis S18K6 TaxID=1127672 RepID=A0AAV3UZ82_9ALTE|nr:hypothetical protein GCHA_2186 [Paraglaciecola chathamensis S18K6]